MESWGVWSVYESNRTRYRKYRKAGVKEYLGYWTHRKVGVLGEVDRGSQSLEDRTLVVQETHWCKKAGRHRDTGDQ